MHFVERNASTFRVWLFVLLALIALMYMHVQCIGQHHIVFTPRAVKSPEISVIPLKEEDVFSLFLLEIRIRSIIAIFEILKA